MPDYTVDTLVDDIKTTASIPSAQPRFSNAGIINIMTRILRSKIVPMMMTVREEYFVDFEDFTIVQGNILGYPIPGKAVGMKVRDVVLMNQSGVLNMTGLPRLSLEQVSGYYFGQVVPFGFYIQNNNVILWPPNQTTPSNTLRMYYLRRTNTLTESSNCGQIDFIEANIVTLKDPPPADWEVGTLLNAIDDQPGFNTIADDLIISEISANNVTIITTDGVFDVPNGLTDNYWLANLGFSPIAQVPVEIQQLLVQATALEILKSLGDTKGYQKLKVEYKELVKYAMDVITPRADGNFKKVISGGNAIADWCGFRWRS
jgi:hypothetical protein